MASFQTLPSLIISQIVGYDFYCRRTTLSDLHNSMAKKAFLANCQLLWICRRWRVSVLARMLRVQRVHIHGSHVSHNAWQWPCNEGLNKPVDSPNEWVREIHVFVVLPAVIRSTYKVSAIHPGGLCVDGEPSSSVKSSCCLWKALATVLNFFMGLDLKTNRQPQIKPLFPNATNVILEVFNLYERWDKYPIGEQQQHQVEINIAQIIKYLHYIAPNVGSITLDNLDFATKNEANLEILAKFSRDILGMAKRRLKIMKRAHPYEAYVGTLTNLGGIVDLTIEVANLSNIWLVQRCHETLQRLKIGGDSITDGRISSIIIDEHGQYVVYPQLRHLQLNLERPLLSFSDWNLPEFPGAIPFPNVEQFQFYGWYPFGDNVLFRSHRSVREHLRLNISPGMARILVKKEAGVGCWKTLDMRMCQGLDEMEEFNEYMEQIAEIAKYSESLVFKYCCSLPIHIWKPYPLFGRLQNVRKLDIASINSLKFEHAFEIMKYLDLLAELKLDLLIGHIHNPFRNLEEYLPHIKGECQLQLCPKLKVMRVVNERMDTHQRGLPLTLFIFGILCPKLEFMCMSSVECKEIVEERWEETLKWDIFRGDVEKISLVTLLP